MALTPSLNYSQSADGKTLTIIDTSNYVAQSIDPASYVRKVQLYPLKDAGGTMLDELTFNGAEISVTYDLTQDLYLSAKLIFTGSPSVASVIRNFGTTEFEYIALDKRLKKNCGCNNCKGCDKTTLGALYLSRAEQQVLAGNPAKFNSYIQASLKVLNS